MERVSWERANSGGWRLLKEGEQGAELGMSPQSRGMGDWGPLGLCGPTELNHSLLPIPDPSGLGWGGRWWSRSERCPLQNGLMVACCKGFVDIVPLLRQCPHIDVNQQDKEGNTALMMAAQAGRRPSCPSLPSATPKMSSQERQGAKAK